MPDENEQNALSKIKAYLDAGHSLDAIRQAGWATWIDRLEAKGYDLQTGEMALRPPDEGAMPEPEPTSKKPTRKEKKEKKGGFFGRAFLGGLFGCFGVGVAIVAVIIIIIVIVAVSLSGNDAEVVSTGPTSTLAPGETREPDAEKPDVLNLNIGDTAKIGDAQVTVEGFRRSTGGDFFSPDSGNVWIIVDATVLNTGDDAYNISSLLQTALRDGEGREYSLTIGPDLQGQLDGTIPPNDILRGETAFEVPENVVGIQFVFTTAFGSQQARWNLR